MTLSVATPTWVTPDSSIIATDVSTPTVAATSRPAAVLREGIAKKWRKSS